MFELHVVVAGIVIFNIMELIMEIVPNYPTSCLLSVSFFYHIFSSCKFVTTHYKHLF
jgi:hypothetical protein